MLCANTQGDVPGLRGRNLNLGEEITVADLEACLNRQKMSADAIKCGDCVFLNIGRPLCGEATM
jgi:hypothetical protein